MTDKVIPSSNGDTNAFIVAQIIEHGASTSGWIVQSGTDFLAGADSDISGAPLNGFQESHSSSSFDVTIDTGEGFVGGAWLGRDVSTTVTLNSSSSGQTVYLGWDASARDSVLIGLDDGSSGDPGFSSVDRKVELWSFDTDGSGVTSATDERDVGRSATLGSIATEDGSEFGRWLSTAISDTPAGTAGNSNNEVYRVGSGTSDMVMSVADGSGRMNLAYNCYFDSSDWRYIIDNEDAFRIEFSDGIKMHVAGPGSADNVASFTSYHIDSSNGNFVAPGGDLWNKNNSEVPKGSLGGPASSLSNYPVPASDINDGDGSGLDADTLDGSHANEIEGKWTHIETKTDSDDTSDVDFEFNIASGDVSDIYQTRVYYENHSGGGNFLRLRLNNDSSSNYNHLHYRGYPDNDIAARTDANNFHGLAGAAPDGFGYGEHQIVCPSNIVSVSENHPKFSSQVHAGPYDTDGTTIVGELEVDYAQVDQLDFYDTSGAATCKIEVYGRDI